MAFQTYNDLEIYQLSHGWAIKILYVTEAITENDIFVSFMVRGKRQYFKSALGLCMGIEKAKKRLVACPSSDSQRNRLDNFVELEPGGESGKNELSAVGEVEDKRFLYCYHHS